MRTVKIWVDDVRALPVGYDVCLKSVNSVLGYLCNNVVGLAMAGNEPLTVLLDLDHDAGDFVSDGGDYIKILDWLEFSDFVSKNPQITFEISVHSANPVGRANMVRIVRKNGWRLL